jgi:nucleotide-binding universal stress UspA family protein
MTATATSTALNIFDRIVCGVDGSPESLEAARQAERLRSPDGTLRVAAVTEVKTAVHAGFAMSHVLEQLDAAARDGLHRAVDEVHPASTHLLAGDPVPSLLSEIDGFDATLVAVGPRGHSRTAGMILGGVATELLHNAPCSVLFARESQFGEFPSSILVGLDGSESSLAAWAVAESIANRFDAELLPIAARGGKGFDAPKVWAVDPYAVIDPGHPVATLTELANEADLLVVGSRGLHGFKALGSVSERVAHRAPCSVLVVRNQQGGNNGNQG